MRDATPVPHAAAGRVRVLPIAEDRGAGTGRCVVASRLAHAKTLAMSAHGCDADSRPGRATTRLSRAMPVITRIYRVAIKPDLRADFEPLFATVALSPAKESPGCG